MDTKSKKGQFFQPKNSGSKTFTTALSNEWLIDLPWLFA